MQNDLALTITKALDQLREDAGSPIWTPLEALLPQEWCAGFMFMGTDQRKVMPDGLVLLRDDADRSTWADRTIFSYKHGITRRYIHIGDDLRCYAYRASDGPDGASYSPVRTETAIEVVFDKIEQYGGTRTTAYDFDFIRARNERLVAAGFTVYG